MEKTGASTYIREIFIRKMEGKTKQNDAFKKSLSMLIDGTFVKCRQFHVLRMWPWRAQQNLYLRAWVTVSTALSNALLERINTAYSK